MVVMDFSTKKITRIDSENAKAKKLDVNTVSYELNHYTKLKFEEYNYDTATSYVHLPFKSLNYYVCKYE